MKMYLVIASLLVILGSHANAGEEPSKPQYKSPGTAAALSTFGTFIPFGVGVASLPSESGGAGTALIVLGGTIFGPGLGHAYAGNAGRFFSGVGLRLLGWGGLMTTVALSWNDGDSGAAIAGALASTFLILGSSIYDIATAPKSARQFNDRHGYRQISLSPTFNPKNSTPGLQLSMSF